MTDEDIINRVDDRAVELDIKPMTKQLEGSVLRPQRRIRVPTFEFCLEKHRNVGLNPPRHFKIAGYVIL